MYFPPKPQIIQTHNLRFCLRKSDGNKLGVFYVGEDNNPFKLVYKKDDIIGSFRILKDTRPKYLDVSVFFSPVIYGTQFHYCIEIDGEIYKFDHEKEVKEFDVHLGSEFFDFEETRIYENDLLFDTQGIQYINLFREGVFILKTTNLKKEEQYEISLEKFLDVNNIHQLQVIGNSFEGVSSNNNIFSE